MPELQSMDQDYIIVDLTVDIASSWHVQRGGNVEKVKEQQDRLTHFACCSCS